MSAKCNPVGTTLRPIVSMALALALLGTAPAAAQAADRSCTRDAQGRMVCPQPGATCLRTPHGEVWCSPADGGIEPDMYGELLCGTGYCVRDRYGSVFCSARERGASSLDMYGKPVCVGGCVAGSARLCTRPEPAR